MFPIAHHFSSHIVWPWFNFHVYNLKREGKGVGKGQREGYLDFYVGECPMFGKDGHILLAKGVCDVIVCVGDLYFEMCCCHR
jgi:hypothetical protein